MNDIFRHFTERQIGPVHSSLHLDQIKFLTLFAPFDHTNSLLVFQKVAVTIGRLKQVKFPYTISLGPWNVELWWDEGNL